MEKDANEMESIEALNGCHHCVSNSIFSLSIGRRYFGRFFIGTRPFSRCCFLNLDNPLLMIFPVGISIVIPFYSLGSSGENERTRLCVRVPERVRVRVHLSFALIIFVLSLAVSVVFFFSSALRFSTWRVVSFLISLFILHAPLRAARKNPLLRRTRQRKRLPVVMQKAAAVWRRFASGSATDKMKFVLLILFA